jgi:hypothetical protein
VSGRTRLAAALVALTCALVPGTAARAQSPPPAPPGFDVEQWAGGYVQRLFAFPGDQQFTCKTGQSYKLYFVVLDAAQTDCRIPAGTPFLVVGAWVECSTLEPFPFYGGTDEELAACTERWWKRWFESASVWVDGRKLTGISRSFVRSPAFDFTLPSHDNLLGSPILHGRAVVKGLFLYLPPFPTGTHSIRTAQAYRAGTTAAHTFTFTVV